MRNWMLSNLWALCASLSIIAGCENAPPQNQDIDTKRAVIIQSVNRILEKEWVSLEPGQQCMITIFGKEKELQAILACDGNNILEYTQSVPNWEKYLTQIFDIESTNAGLLNPNQWCIILEVNSKAIQWNQCEDTQEKPDKMKKPSNWRNFLA